ncbi:helix-turn-helix transcriptional regulator [uncultured Chitinophaga sp.]|uniref:AraC family transcriptional regulator n=1 Tax=uncultured Chitinophaga sp. TaxID=339340 RepID=UPI0025F580D2|nr:helix-turn-helix transcriptional regulator [uncultured Chitinophaga sp.]
MSTSSVDIKIANYAFEPDEATGNPMFRINRNDGVTNYKKADFLVPHRKEYYFFAFVREGSSRHWIDMKQYVLKPDTFYFTVPHQVHLKEETRPLTGMSMSFSEDFLSLDATLKSLPLIRNPHNGHELQLTAADVAFVDDVLNKIYDECHGKANWQQGMLLALVKVLLIYLSRLYNGQFSEPALFKNRALLDKYLQYIETSYTELHEVAGYAELMNVSPGHLGDLVKEQSGKPAITHIHDRLALEARRLLFHTDKPVKEIAYELGFEDVSYFIRFFKRLAGDTPAKFRDDIRKMYH